MKIAKAIKRKAMDEADAMLVIATEARPYSTLEAYWIVESKKYTCNVCLFLNPTYPLERNVCRLEFDLPDAPIAFERGLYGKRWRKVNP